MAIDDLGSAEKLKAEGNILFSKGKYGAAIERYTEGIALVGNRLPALFVNRAMAHKRREEWDRVLEDASAVLVLDSRNVKASYLAGVAHLHKADFETAVRYLNKALDSARESNDSIKDDIWRELARAKYSQWQQDSARKRQMLESLKLAINTGGMATPVQEGWDWALQTLLKMDTPMEVPSAFTCPLTLETYRDPAITKWGQTYERSSLLEHLKNHKWDPITRAEMSETDVWPNVGLRQAVYHYLEEHPWAWGDCI